MTLVLSLWAAVAAAFSWVAVYRLGRRPAGAAKACPRPPVLLLRPVDAPSPLELANLSAPIDYDGQLSHWVLSPYRPRLPASSVGWLPSDPTAENRKVGHLAYALAVLPQVEGAVVVCVDADVRVDGALLGALVDEVCAGAALATAPPRPQRNATLVGLGVRGLLTQTHHAFDALDVMSAGARAVCGKAFALGDGAAVELVRLTDRVGEDLELAQVLHAKGLRVSMARSAAEVPQPAHPSLAAAFERFTRWMQVLRAHRPALYPTVPLLFAPTPLLLGLALALGQPLLAGAVGLLVAGRLALAHRLDRGPGLRVEWLLAELLLLASWLGSVRAGRRVSWRGRTFALAEGGRMHWVAPALRGGLG